MRLTRIALLLLCTIVAIGQVAAAAAAQENKGRPPKARTQRTDRPMRPPGPPPEEMVNWDEVRDFYATHSPHRWQAFDNLPPDRQQKVRGFLAHRYLTIQWLKRPGSEDLLAIKKDELRIEDDIFQIHLDVDKAGGAGSPNSQKLLTEMRGKVKELVAVRMREREERIKHLRGALQTEEARLADDRNNIGQIEDEEFQAELRSRPGEEKRPN